MTASLPQSAATALWVLHHCPDRRDAERWAATAVQRGATQQQADDELAAWDAENAPAVWHADLDAAIARHPARRARIPDHLTGSDRRGGGDPMADYLHLKGEL